MMIEAIEVILPLLRGEVVSKRTDWFTLDDARLQLRPFSHDGVEVAVASASSPTGAVLAGRLGLGVLALAANDPVGFNALDTNWDHYEDTALAHGMPAERDRWRAVATMHLAETREQAARELEHGVLTLCGYFEGMSNSKMPWAGSPRDAVTHWIENGFPNFGIATVGTPDDALAIIDKLSEKSGGFGTFLFLAHNCADWSATKRSYELFAEHVIPACRGMNVGRSESMGWIGQNSGRFFGAMLQATQEAIDKYSRPDDQNV